MQWLSRLEDDGMPRMRAGWRRYLSNYFGAVRMVDDQIARLVGALDELRLREETLLVFVDDHGDYLMQYGLGRKGVGLSEALTHIPMVSSGAGLPALPANTRDVVSMADLMPTLCDAMQQPVPAGVQGNSLWRLLHGNTQQGSDFESVCEHRAGRALLRCSGQHSFSHCLEGPCNHHLWDTLNMVTQSGSEKMVRKGDWKLIYDMMGYGQL